MRLKVKLMLFGLSVGMIAFQFANCARFLGDLAGDITFLRAVD